MPCRERSKRLYWLFYLRLKHIDKICQQVMKDLATDFKIIYTKENISK